MNTAFKLLLILTFAISITFYSCSQKSSKENWEVLFDGTSLENWDTYSGPKYKFNEEGQTVLEDTLFGLNNDQAKVYTIVDLDGEKALRISGEIFGAIITKHEFENYHLRLQVKWGDKKWFPRDNSKRDSGILYHSVGKQGDGDTFWLRSQEFQVQEGDCGDYWGVAGGMFDIRAKLNADSIYQYDPEGELITFSEDNETGRYCKKFPDAENPSGEWNTIDVYCFKDTSIHVVNGVVNMVLENSRLNLIGNITPLTKGKIQIQSEGAEVFYRDIKVCPIEGLPDFN